VSSRVTSPDYRPRLAGRWLAETRAQFPAVMLTGARAVGKTTTAAQLARQVVRLDEPRQAAIWRADPDAALSSVVVPALLDEWQEVPEVLGALKRSVDSDSTPGRFLLAILTSLHDCGLGRPTTKRTAPMRRNERTYSD